MKTLMLLMTLAMSFNSFSEEISEAQIKEFLMQNRETYTKVFPGMTAEYRTRRKISEINGQIDECIEASKEVVISNENNLKYLVYVKNTEINGCSQAPKGQVHEYLEWRDLYNFEPTEEDPNFSITYDKINKMMNIITASGYECYNDEGVCYRFVYFLDISKSQFFSIIIDVFDNTIKDLIRTGHTDPATIDISDLEIQEN